MGRVMRDAMRDWDCLDWALFAGIVLCSTSAAALTALLVFLVAYHPVQ